MIFWVYGGTAVGKKHFMGRAVENPGRFDLPPGLAAAWIADGDMSPEELVEISKRSPALVRWQWGRENNVGMLRESNPSLYQEILVVRADVHIQVERVIQREGCLKWDAWRLLREADDVQHLVEQLSMKYQLPVRYIDGNA